MDDPALVAGAERLRRLVQDQGDLGGAEPMDGEQAVKADAQ